MIVNANKLGKKSESTSNSVSPTRRGTGTNELRSSSKSPGGGLGPKNTPVGDGTSMLSANSSGKYSARQIFGGPGGGTNESVRGEPLEMMQCPSHEGQSLDHYSINIREFMCKLCIKEIEGTQREIDLNPIQIEDAFKILENRLNMQTLVNLDEKIRTLLDLVKKKKDFSIKDKEESLKQVAK